jgi:hypothetical protein
MMSKLLWMHRKTENRIKNESEIDEENEDDEEFGSDQENEFEE